MKTKSTTRKIDATRKQFLLSWSKTGKKEKRTTLKERCRTDLRFFARTFFPDTCRLPWNDLHLYLFQRRLEKTQLLPPLRRGQTDSILAPRGAAKSTLVSLVFPLHAMLYGLDPYIILISATDRQATTRLANMRNALNKNPRFQKYFASELKALRRPSLHALQIGECRIEAFGAGCELRGMTFGPWRPTWIVLDDVELSARIVSQKYREDLAAWLNEVVGNLGNGYTNIDLVGTLLHTAALPARLAERPDVTAKTFRAIEQEADRQDLWDQWRAKFFDLADPDRLASARAHFDANKPEMMRGAEVLWSRKESYYDLQVIRAGRGERAFEKEKQNNPPADEASLFPAEVFARFNFEGTALAVRPAPGPVACPAPPRVERSDLRVFGFLDPALGEGGEAGRPGDFAAIVTVGLDRHGYLFVLDAWLERAGPSAQLARIFDLHEKWRYQDFGIEVNAFQQILLDPLARERERRRAAGRPSDVPVHEVRHRTSKQARIAALEPLARSGWLILGEHLPPEFMSQLTNFPGARHDDAPDALAAAVDLARRSTPNILSIQTVPSRTLRRGGY